MSFVLGVLISAIINIKMLEIPPMSGTVTEYIVTDDVTACWQSKVTKKGFVKKSASAICEPPEQLICHSVEDRSFYQSYFRNLP